MKRRTKAVVFAIMMSIACCTSSVAFAEPIDLSQHWAYETMRYFLEREEIQIEFKEQFDPDQTITRIEFVEMINLLWPGTLTIASDQKNDHLAEELTSVADESDQDDQITSDEQSMDETLNMPITREEAAFLLVSIKKYTRESDELPLMDYLDGDKVSPWAKEAVEIMVQRGVLKGYPCGKLYARASMTQAEAMTLLKTVEEEDGRNLFLETDLARTYGLFHI